MRTASDLMTANTIVVGTGFTISQCMDLFLEHKISTAPVVDGDRKLKGILTEFAIIRAFTGYTLNGNDDTVGKHMDLLTEAFVVLDTDPVHVVITHMKKAISQRLVVTNKANHVVGIVSPCDVMKFLNAEHKKYLNVDSKMKNQEKIIQSVAIKKMGKELKAEFGVHKELTGDLDYPLYALDTNGNVVFANRKMHELLDCPLWTLVDTSIDSLFTKAHIKIVRGDVKKMMIEKQEITKRYVEILVDQKKSIWVQLHTCAHVDKNGDPLGVITVFKPVEADVVLRALTTGNGASAA